MDCSKALRVLPEFKPQWNVRKGAQELYEAYQKVGLTLEEFEGTRFSRIAHLKSLIGNGLLDKDLHWQTDEALRTAAV